MSEEIVKQALPALTLDNPELQEMLAVIRDMPPQVLTVQSQTAQFDFGEEIYKPTIAATILGDVRPRTWWELPAGGEGTRPDCYAPDGITPAADSPKKQAETCAECPLSKFGSGKNGGQACGQKAVLIALEPDQFLPIAIRFPRTSTRSVDEFYRRLFRDKRVPSSVVTEFSLVKTTTGGNTYSVATLKTLRAVTEEEAAKIEAIRPYVKGMKDQVSGASRAASEVPF